MRNATMKTFGIFILLLCTVFADYDCFCNYATEIPVYDRPGDSGSQIGSLFEFDCKPLVQSANKPSSYAEIHFQQQTGFVRFGQQNGLQVCPGTPAIGDINPNINAASATSFRTTAPSVLQPSTQIPIPEGHTDLCPDHMKSDAHWNHGFVGQFGNYCYELVDSPTQWDNAHRHCSLTSASGNLLYIQNKQEQNFIVRFLAQHQYVKAVWTGLNDIHREGNWQWHSGSPVTYTNFQKDFNSHSSTSHTYHDCIILQQGGEWKDVNCGLSMIIGFGVGESHPYVCQYNVTSKPDSIFHIFGEALLPSIIG